MTPAPPPVAASAATALGDEERFFLQFMAPRVLRRRLEFAVYELGPRVPRLAEHQTILAALIWKYADYSNADALRELGGLLDVFEADPLSQLHADSKVGGNVPNSLRRMIDGAVLRLKDTHEQASRRSVGGALLWRYVDPDDTQSLDALEQTLLDYEAAAWPKRATSRSSAAA